LGITDRNGIMGNLAEVLYSPERPLSATAIDIRSL
jgi:hypothetical protein